MIVPTQSMGTISAKKPAEAQHFSGLFHSLIPQGANGITRFMIVPTLRVGMPPVTFCVTLWDAERPGLHSHAEHGNDQRKKAR
ncbi:hypothetical protein [Pseudomonas sp. Root562]|uniref:hypothetical protein n=1 Tax=Pseudomonas sp. Root562 TaxID=1736561 RepID=UPI0007034EDB|nr:hypothetical protein [Pseudomonas sp. Root562]KQZ94814.1 hypothetical protein ASD60_02115 [Pseudomonas sp. Root562]